VGYSGGRKANPTYFDLGDHTETLQVDFDPARISYGEILDLFWRSHSCAAPAFSRQYMNAVFAHGSEQRRLAEESLKREAERIRGKVRTRILPASRFYLAEAYHQKYRLRRVRKLVREYQVIYPELKGFVDSTAVARVNGFVGGHGTRELLEAEIAQYGLSDRGKKVLLGIVQDRRGWPLV
jgi:methionine-S-sulfoxide reductase